jgi:hypothetical protein
MAARAVSARRSGSSAQDGCSRRAGSTSARPARFMSDELTGDSPALEDCISAFRLYMHLPDPGPLLVSLATVVANRAEGDPLWLLLVGGPSTGKTEPVRSLDKEPDCHLVGHITEAGLLSATPKRERGKDAHGGLLREVGEFGILLVKDFTSILSLQRDTRASLLAALRETYDGSWTRSVGTDGGRTLEWKGKLGLLGCVTGAIDSAHGVMGLMGERFVLYRMPEASAADQARVALRRSNNTTSMRFALSAAVAAVLARAKFPARHLTDEEETWLVALAQLVVRARSVVERDSYSREIVLVPEPEAPARLVQGLRQLLFGLEAIAVEPDEARRIVNKAGLDSMPVIRRQVLELLAREPVTNAGASELLAYPPKTCLRTLEDLAAHGLTTRHTDNKAHRWEMAETTRQLWKSVFPEMSETYSSQPSLSITIPLGGDKTGKQELLDPWPPRGAR